MKLEKVSEPGGRTAGMRADLRQRTQSHGKFSRKEKLPKLPTWKQVPGAAIIRGTRHFWVISPTWLEEGKKREQSPSTLPS